MFSEKTQYIFSMEKKAGKQIKTTDVHERSQKQKIRKIKQGEFNKIKMFFSFFPQNNFKISEPCCGMLL
jgi:hypothetical protein